MKPMHLATLGAVVVVGVLVYLMVADTDDRQHRDRREIERTPASAGTAPDQPEAARPEGTLSVSLEVRMPDGSPASGAALELTGRARVDATADPEGRVEIAGLHPGLYNLLARKDRAAGYRDFELKRSLDLGTLTLAEAVSIRGRVFDSHGTPLGGARVEAVHMPEQAGFDMTSIVQSVMAPEPIAAHAETQADGAYELIIPSGGTYALRATARGFAQEAEAPRLYAAAVEGLDFHLFPGVQVAGRVVDARGAPVVGAHVMLLDVMMIFTRRAPKAETLSTGDGTFSLVVMPSDRIMLVVRAVGYATHIQPNLALPALDLAITLEAGIAVRLNTVDADEPAMPAPHVRVAVMYRGGFAAGRTDEQGQLFVENLPVKGTRMLGNQQQAILWGGGYVARTIQLAQKEPRDGVLDAGTIEMSRGGVARGKVRDKQTGDPVEGAQVRSLGGLGGELQFMGATTALSGPDGAYELRGVPLAAHALVANHPDYASDLDPFVFAQAMQGGGKALFPEGRREIERDLLLTPAVAVTGTVLSPDGTPVAGAKVEARDQMSMLRQLMGGGARVAVSDADGRFVLGGLKPDEAVAVAASHREYGSSARKPARPGQPVTLTLTRPLLIKGRVVDEQDEPLAAVRVTVDRKQQPGTERTVFAGPEEQGAARPAVTDANGDYVVRNAPPGELVVTFSHPRYSEIKTDLNIAPGTPETELGRTVLPRGLGIEGVVVDEKGEPVPNVRVSVSWHLLGTAVPAGPGRSNSTATTDKQGRFAVFGLKEGSYELRVWQEGLYGTRPVVATGTRDARVVLRQGGRLSGRVTVRGLPVANASISARIAKTQAGGVTSTDHVGWGRTDADGRFTLTSLPPDRPFDLHIEHEAYKAKDVPGVRASEVVQHFALEEGVVIGGKVVDPEGQPVANAQLWVRVNGAHAKSVRSGPDGRFAAGGLDEGEITVGLAQWNQDFISTGPVAVTPGDTSVRIVAEAGESILGTVYGPDGAPIQQVRIVALDAQGKVAGTAWVWSETGAFAVRGLRKGTYALRASRFADGKEEVLAELDGIATGSVDVEIRSDA
ncbi:MAG: carboxypeptidase regulatory-like domain-containing protein [Planctomycetota bacterium]|jgi:protocatechuate 3,4-dioxygenase beta subunit